MTESASQPTYDKRNLWKLALICVPALLSGISSYAKSRAEATDQAKATFEHIETDIDALQAEMLKHQEARFALMTEVAVLKAQLEAVSKRSEESRHWAAAPAPVVAPPVVVPSVAAPLTVSVRPAVKPLPKPRVGGDSSDGGDARMVVGKPSFDEVVQAYKSKK